MWPPHSPAYFFDEKPPGFARPKDPLRKRRVDPRVRHEPLVERGSVLGGAEGLRPLGRAPRLGGPALLQVLQVEAISESGGFPQVSPF